MTHRTVREWGRVDLGGEGFTRAQADVLLAAARAHPLAGLDGTNILTDHHRYLRAQQMVGVVAGAGCSLEILPKVDPDAAEEAEGTVRARLVHMLDVALDLRLSQGERTGMGHAAESLLEVFIAAFASRLLEELRRGAPRHYQSFDADLPTIRGRWDVARQFTALAAHPDRLACRFDALDATTPILIVMKACVALLCRHARRAATHRQLAELRHLLADLPAVPRGALPWRQIQIERGTRRWQPLLDLARLLLGERWQQTHVLNGGPQGITLLFSMHELFERYVAHQLRQALRGTGLEVVAQGGFRHCLGDWQTGVETVGSSHPTRPDLLIMRGRGVAAVLDTKWKLLTEVQHSDVYQMMAYARLYRSDRLALLYPAVSAERPSNHRHGIADGRERLDVVNLALHKGSEAVQTQLREYVLSAVSI